MNSPLRQIVSSIIVSATAFLLVQCSTPGERKLFEEMSPAKTGILFANTVVQQGESNVLNYPYFFNGAGVAVGDINNDGLPDVYFSGNQVPNKLYLNKGDFKFEDITDKAGVAVPNGWKTGVTMADVNQDGFLDIYVCRSAMSDSVLRKNLLFINNGNNTFTEKADEYGIGNSSYSTQAAFFDYDKDGDLDLFLVNHSLPKYGGFSKVLKSLKTKRDTRFGSALYQNNNGKFNDVSEKAGIVNNVLSFGLGVAVSDVNSDGWPDVYISNDFNEEDYLYLNNHDGTFRNVIKEATGHVSLFSMGSDIADMNNDGLPDIFTLDMMPESNQRIKMSSGDDNYDKYHLLISQGFHEQSMRNMLQLNNGNGTFSEIGQYAGISNTDWSWAPLFADFDGDGNKDLFITNGYEKDYTNMQFLKFMVDKITAEKGKQPDTKTILENLSPIETGNYIFKNNGDYTFTKKTNEWGITHLCKSNGAAYADLDNDGDPDLLVNTMNLPAIIYKNNSLENSKTKFLKADLIKNNLKRNVIGTKIFAYTDGKLQFSEFYPTRGFQSSMNVPLSISSMGKDKLDSIRVIWPDDKTQLFVQVSVSIPFQPSYSDATEIFRYPKPQPPLFDKINAVEWIHKPVDTIDFKRQFLLPKMYSYSGPKIIKGDADGDGLEDIFICAPKHQASALFMQQKNGSFVQKKKGAFERDKEYQDEDAVFFDSDGDGDLDLYVVSGGYPFNFNDVLLQDRLYINDGKGNFTRSVNQLPAETLAGSCVVALDADGDHDLDLFIGSRLIPGNYPTTPDSQFLLNDGKGNFKNAIHEIAPGLVNQGMITSAKTIDLNKDNQPDLVVAGEWMSPKIFINKNGSFTDETSVWMPESREGFWNCILTGDFDKDGDVDLIFGNYGMNNQYKADSLHPVTLTYKDFNKDGQIDPFLSYYIGDTSYPFASRDEALGQVGFLRQRFTDYNAYSNTTLETIFTKEELNGASVIKASDLKTVYMENKGGHFIAHTLPAQTQFSSIYAIAALDVDHDGDEDLVIGGNESNVRVRIGRMDASRGTVLINDGKGNFSCLAQCRSGLDIKGDVRDMISLSQKDGDLLLVGINGARVESYRLGKE